MAQGGGRRVSPPPNKTGGVGFNRIVPGDEEHGYQDLACAQG